MSDDLQTLLRPLREVEPTSEELARLRAAIDDARPARRGFRLPHLRRPPPGGARRRLARGRRGRGGAPLRPQRRRVPAQRAAGRRRGRRRGARPCAVHRLPAHRRARPRGGVRHEDARVRPRGVDQRAVAGHRAHRRRDGAAGRARRTVRQSAARQAADGSRQAPARAQRRLRRR